MFRTLHLRAVMTRIMPMGFSTPSYDLADLFNRIDRGDLQLPDFQRSYCWDVDRIRSLLVTVLRGYPVGALMALDTRNEPMRFRPRPLQGAPEHHVSPGLLLLDGQQRLTSLYQCLRGEGLVESVDFRSKNVRRRFYVDVEKAVSSEVMPDEAVISVDESGVVRSHFAETPEGGITSREAALAHGCIPVSALLSDEATDMLFDMAAGADAQARDNVRRFNNKVVKPLAGYSIPMVRLDRATAQGGIGSIFAQANSSGMQMDVFELLTSLFAAQDPDFDLLKDWEKTDEVLRKYPALDGIGKTEFLTAVALYVSARNGKASAQRESTLKLSVADYAPAAKKMRAAFHESAHYMSERCILSTSQVPYAPQLIPLAVIIALLAEEPGLLSKQEAWNRLNRWFWCGVFGELYGSPALTVRMGTDVDEVTSWIRAAEAGKDNEVETPKSIRNARFVESRLLSAGPESGLYKGIYALLMGRGARDWRTGQAFDRHNAATLGVHFRPVFPEVWCDDNDVDRVLADSVLNYTPMGRRTYVMIEGSSPARYLARIQSKSLMDDQEFDEVLATHMMDPHLVLSANANEFFRDRRQRLIAMIEEAIGGSAVMDVDEENLGGGEEGPDAFRPQ